MDFRDKGKRVANASSTRAILAGEPLLTTLESRQATHEEPSFFSLAFFKEHLLFPQDKKS
jgi:hypothetical protein